MINLHGCGRSSVHLRASRIRNIYRNYNTPSRCLHFAVAPDQRRTSPLEQNFGSVAQADQITLEAYGTGKGQCMQFRLNAHGHLWHAGATSKRPKTLAIRRHFRHSDFFRVPYTASPVSGSKRRRRVRASLSQQIPVNAYSIMLGVCGGNHTRRHRAQPTGAHQTRAGDCKFLHDAEDIANPVAIPTVRRRRSTGQQRVGARRHPATTRADA